MFSPRRGEKLIHHLGQAAGVTLIPIPILLCWKKPFSGTLNDVYFLQLVSLEVAKRIGEVNFADEFHTSQMMECSFQTLYWESFMLDDRIWPPIVLAIVAYFDHWPAALIAFGFFNQILC